MSGRTPSAHWPVPSLVTSLSRAGWGELSGREWQGVRSTLRAVMDQLPHKSGQGWTTAPQIAQSAGLSEKWVRRCLHLLENLGVITWQRGGVVDGKPQPSFVTIVKRVLVDLIKAARPVKDAADRAHRVATGARIAHLRNVRSKEPRSRRSDHTELSTSPRALRGGSTGARPSVVDIPTPTSPEILGVYTLGECEHGFDASRRTKDGLPWCPVCRREVS